MVNATRLAVYYGPYSQGQNSQTSAFINEFGELDLASVIVNTGETKLKGIEFEFDAAPTENLNISGSFGLADSRVDVFTCSDGTQVYGSDSCAGNALPSASKYTWSLSAEYQDTLSGDYDWFTRIDYSHQGKAFTDYTNVAWRGPQEIVNARIGIRTEDMTLEAFVTNLLNDDTPPSAVIANDLFTFATSNEFRYALPKKRQFGVLAGCESWVEIAKYGERKLTFLRRFRPFTDGTPSHDQLGDIFAALDAEQFQHCFIAWAASLTGRGADIDGKTLRRSY